MQSDVKYKVNKTPQLYYYWTTNIFSQTELNAL